MAKTRNKFKFSIGGEKGFVIPSKMFPLSYPNQIEVFAEDICSELAYPELAAALDRIRFESGRCYTNAQTVVDIGQSLGLPVQYFCGWYFTRDMAPLHHAWAVLDGNVIDVSVSKAEKELLERGVDYSNPRWRDDAALELIRLRRTRPATSKDCIFGKPFKDHFYLGCPDEYEASRKRFRDLLERFPNHVCYRHKMEPSGRSKLQEVIRQYEEAGL